MTAQLSPPPVFKGFANDGTPLAYGLLYTWIAGTTTPQATYVDSTQTTPNTNPVVLNARGECALWLAPTLAYKLNLTDLNGNQIPGYPVDNILTDTPLPIDSTNVHYDITAAEISASITPTNYYYQPMIVERYGADPTGLADSTAAFNAAFVVGKKIPGGATASSYDGGKYLINGTLVPDLPSVGFDGKGCTINATGKTSATGPLWAPTFATATNSAFIPGEVQKHPLQNFTAQGPGASQTCVFIVIQDLLDTFGGPLACGVVVRNGGSESWFNHAQFGNGAFFTLFESWNFVQGVTSNTFVTIPVSTNAGERNTFRSCRFDTTTARSILIQQGASDTYFENCSFNYCSAGFVDQQAGAVFFNDCHVESNFDVNNWIKVSQSDAMFRMEGGEIVVGGALATASVFESTSAVTGGGGVFLQGVNYLTSFATGVPLIAGPGNARIQDISEFGSAALLGITAASLNLLADGGFEANSITKDWTVTGTTPPTTSNTDPHSGTFSMKITGQSGTTNQASRIFPCQPGNRVHGQLWATMTAYTNGTLFGELVFLDFGGNSLGATVFLNITANSAYTLYTVSKSTPAPLGTVSVQIILNIFGTTSGTPIAYIDDIFFGIT